jgi:hypothetical protein
MRAVNLVFAAIGGCALVVAVDRGKCVLHGVGDSVPDRGTAWSAEPTATQHDAHTKRA